MRIFSKPVLGERILKEYNRFFKDMIKSVVDLQREIIALDGELHADLEEVKNCYERALELLDLTIEITKNKNRLKEYLRLREMMESFILKKKVIQDSTASSSLVFAQ